MRVVLDGVSKSFGRTPVIEDLDLEVRDGEMMALLGPSGCGKTTTLLCVSGIHRASAGRILFGEREVHLLRPQERNVGIVFQNYALYPHLSVYENIAFPLRIRKEAQGDIRRKVRDIASILRVPELLDRRPAQLSGGQQQRIALARALVREPDVLLMDEPLANLDAALRLEMRTEVRRIQRETGVSAILVTHDQVEAMSMCDRIALMQGGRIQQVGTATEMYEQPLTRFVAGFLGHPPICFCEGTVTDGRFDAGTIGFVLPESIYRAIPSSESRIAIGIRPEHFQPEHDVKVDGEISFIEPLGRETVVDVTLTDGKLVRSIRSGKPSFRVGDSVRWGFEKESLLYFDSRGNRLKPSES